jgi:hypothetical protein
MEKTAERFPVRRTVVSIFFADLLLLSVFVGFTKFPLVVFFEWRKITVLSRFILSNEENLITGKVFVAF